MYLYDTTEGLGQFPTTLGPGIDPIGAQKTMCPLLRDDGRDLEWLDYVLRTRSPQDPLSKYKRFINEVAYRAYVESCKQDTIEELKKHIRLFPWSKPPTPRPPFTPPPGFCLEKCMREFRQCPGGRASAECRGKGRECMRNCEGVLV